MFVGLGVGGCEGSLSCDHLFLAAEHGLGAATIRMRCLIRGMFLEELEVLLRSSVASAQKEIISGYSAILITISIG